MSILERFIPDDKDDKDSSSWRSMTKIGVPHKKRTKIPLLGSIEVQDNTNGIPTSPMTPIHSISLLLAGMLNELTWTYWTYISDARAPKGLFGHDSFNFVGTFWSQIYFGRNIGMLGFQSVAMECPAHTALFFFITKIRCFWGGGDTPQIRNLFSWWHWIDLIT